MFVPGPAVWVMDVAEMLCALRPPFMERVPKGTELPTAPLNVKVPDVAPGVIVTFCPLGVVPSRLPPKEREPVFAPDEIVSPDAVKITLLLKVMLVLVILPAAMTVPVAVKLFNRVAPITPSVLIPPASRINPCPLFAAPLTALVKLILLLAEMLVVPPEMVIAPVPFCVKFPVAEIFIVFNVRVPVLSMLIGPAELKMPTVEGKLIAPVPACVIVNPFGPMRVIGPVKDVIPPVAPVAVLVNDEAVIASPSVRLPVVEVNDTLPKATLSPIAAPAVIPPVVVVMLSDSLPEIFPSIALNAIAPVVVFTVRLFPIPNSIFPVLNLIATPLVEVVKVVGPPWI